MLLDGVLLQPNRVTKAWHPWVHIGLKPFIGVSLDNHIKCLQSPNIVVLFLNTRILACIWKVMCFDNHISLSSLV